MSRVTCAHSTDHRLLRAVINDVCKSTSKGLGTFAEYVVHVLDVRATPASWTLHKRYSEFRTLRDALLRAPLCSPCLLCFQQPEITLRFPRRRIFTSGTARALLERREQLAVFLSMVTHVSQRCADSNCTTRPLVEGFLMVPPSKTTAPSMPDDEPLDEPIPMLEDHRAPKPKPPPIILVAPRRLPKKAAPALTINFQSYRSAVAKMDRTKPSKLAVSPLQQRRPRQPSKLPTIEEGSPFLSSTINEDEYWSFYATS
ncbi:hypothetical protein SDRG_09354 [Saprolegnia diclina VS20]|uniref:PX domain-containing protein n=1 Tax=Saprolegnia diclina (strain VS20) TaxID=1156394 RepID=T0QDJ1_SAPDV|nr:hypothetical protein SDRG_09354 [Saprolegnia diclina VS20]EQC32816.1 hypothetical protein SDRG_09354 [Saprolegnia diclina VS20]|eukprot:XP_008613502.1 hypothetical protein SDRG_09354 [Saprolegnia diclina VS20]